MTTLADHVDENKATTTFMKVTFYHRWLIYDSMVTIVYIHIIPICFYLSLYLSVVACYTVLLVLICTAIDLMYYSDVTCV